MKKCQKLELIFYKKPADDLFFIKKVRTTLVEVYGNFDFYIRQKKDNIETYISEVEKEGKWKYEFLAADLSFKFGFVRAFNHSFICINEKKPGALKNWRDWVQNFLSVDGFVQAWVIDSDYDFWQNAEQIAEYESRGRDYGDIRLISNNLPPPLNEFFVDISKNPGRRVLKDGYVEAVGDKMWFSDIFWELIGGRRFEEMSSAGWQVEEIEKKFCFASVKDETFSESSDISHQNKLRNSIFGN